MTALPRQSLLILLVVLCSTHVWAQVHTDAQLDLMDNTLEKWKPDLHYSNVKDIFIGREYRPDFEHLPQDATVWDQAPESFANDREARRSGAVCDYIKTATNKTCLLRITGGQGAWIFVYDPDPAGHYVKTGVITPKTWHDIGLVQLVDAFGSGKPKLVLIEHQGDSGTDVNERIHWLLGWHNGAFRTLFRETVLLDVCCLGERTVYRVNYHLVKGKIPRIEATYCLDAVYVTAYPYDFHSHWRDWLFWNEHTFSFYDDRHEEEQVRLGSLEYNKLELRLEVERNRQRILKLPPLPLQMWDYDEVTKYWQDIGIRPTL
jgi:hypothetical protein